MSPVSICGGVVIVNAIGVMSGVAVATGEVLWSNDLRTKQSELFSAPRCVLPGAVPTMATSAGASIVFLTNGNNKSQTSVNRVGIRSGQVLFSTVLRPGMPIDLTLGVFVDVPNDRVLALLATPSPRGPGTFSTDILTVSTLQLSTGAPKRLTRVSDILFSTITAQVASVSVPSSTSTWLYFTTGSFVWKSPFRANPVVYCRPFE